MGNIRKETEEERQLRLIRTALQALPDDYPVNLRRAMEYAAYIQGARKAILKVAEIFPQLFKGKDAPYNKAVFDLITGSLKATDFFLTELTADNRQVAMRYDNHVRDNRGRLKSCDACFCVESTILQKI